MSSKNTLRTLKDFPIINFAGHLKETGSAEQFYSEEMLKAEAVKDYKAVKNGDLITDIASYIRWKNNLTEEDLK